ncbi:hypothetical protein JST56_07090 [Candidatus Dependentiae bacterium]|nr:hypothetical protein [Candidatus Dependentiae bacterium]
MSLLLVQDKYKTVRFFNISAAIVFAGLMIDKALFRQYHLETDDYIIFSMAAITALYAIFKFKEKIEPDNILLLIVTLVKIVSELTVYGNDKLIKYYAFHDFRSYFEVGGSIANLLMAIYISRKLVPIYFMPVLYMAFMAVELFEYIGGNPYVFGIHEAAITGLVCWALMLTRKLIPQVLIQRP